MIELFEKYVGWKILAHFLRNPNTWFHVKELGRILRVSPGSVSTITRALEAEGVLITEEKGLARLSKLNPEHPAIPSLKKAYGIALVLEANPADKFAAADENLVSAALFGSYADGSYDEKSDIDFLAITPSNRNKFITALREIEKALGKKVNISVFTLAQWRQTARKKDAFYKRVTENHVLLHGSGLI